MAKDKLTPGRIASFSCPSGMIQGFLWDKSCPGLAVRATPGGRKTFVFQGKLLNGQSIRVTIGDVTAWTLESVTNNKGEEVARGARQEARRLQTLIDQGVDPRQDKAEKVAKAEAKRAEQKRRVVTVREAWNTYIEARRHKWSARHLLDHEKLARVGGDERQRRKGIKTVNGPLASLMPLRLKDLTAERVEQWLKDETASRPTYAALGYRLLRAFVRWAAEHKDFASVTHADAVGSSQVKDHVPTAKAKEADSLQREQLALWFDAVLKIPNRVLSAYLQILLLTGARREELAALTWENVDFRWNSLTIGDKVEGERTIPLTPYMASLLREIRTLNNTPPNVRQLRRMEEQGKPDWKPSPWVFASRAAASGRLKDARAAHVRALNAAGLPHVSLHGLRRSFGTLSEWVECPVGVVAQIQGHKPSAIAEKHYRRRPLDLLRMWHTRIESWILNEAGIESPTQSKKTGLRVVEGGAA